MMRSKEELLLDGSSEGDAVSRWDTLKVPFRGEVLEKLPAELDEAFASLSEYGFDDVDQPNVFDDAMTVQTLNEICQDSGGATEVRDDILQAYERLVGVELNEDEKQEMITELGVNLIVRAFATGELNKNVDHVRNTSELMGEIGLQYPLAPNADNIVVVDNATYDVQRKLKEIGVVDGNFLEAVQQYNVNLYCDGKGREALLDSSSPAHEYWRTISNDLGEDMLKFFLKEVGGGRIGGAGYPTQQAFGTHSILMNRAFDRTRLKARNAQENLRQTNLNKLALRFLQKNEDRLTTPIDRLLVEISQDVNIADTKEYEKFGRKASNIRSGVRYSSLGGRVEYFDSEQRPTQELWEKMYFAGVPAMGKACLERSGIEYTDAQKAYLDLSVGVQDDLARYIGQQDEYEQNRLQAVNELLDENGALKDMFYHRGVLGDGVAEDVARGFSEQLTEHFDGKEVTYLQLPKAYRQAFCELFGRKTDSIKSKYDITEVLSGYFDDGKVKPEFFKSLFNRGQYKLLLDGTIDIDSMQLGNAQRYFLEKYSQIKNEALTDILDRGMQTLDFENISTKEDVDYAMRIVERVQTSNAIELRRSGASFLENVVQAEDPDVALDQIEAVFLHNNLPYAAKSFKTFQILHPLDSELDYKIISVRDRGVLGKLPERGIRSKEAVLFTDLMKASIDSNSRSMRNWIKQVRAGNRQYLDTAYRQTRAGKDDPEGSFATTKRYSEADRAVRSFGYMLGLKGIDDLERRMNEKVAEADKKGRERYARNDFRIEKGDLVKAIYGQYIGDMLQNGIVCKEFLNGEVASDATPLDADLNRIDEDVDGSVSAGIGWKNMHSSFGVTPVNLVLKNDGRFVSEADETKYDPEKFTLWHNDNANYGVRVGFPSSAIDFITFDTNMARQSEKDFICQEIAKNGFYIPVVDQDSGECIFSPEDFDELRRKLSGLETYGGGEYQFAEDGDLADAEIAEIAKGLISDGEKVTEKREAINRELERVLVENFPGFRGLKVEADGDLAPGYFELLDIGSTGRGTSVPGGKADFDFIMRVDAAIFNDAERKNSLEQMFRENLQIGVDKSTGNGMRFKDVVVPGSDELVDIDISLVQRTNRMEFSTDQAVKERLEAMFVQDPARAQLTVANIVKAKEVLKDAAAYKPKHSSDETDPQRKGGLGGVGVENWILQNGGSLKQAARSFLAAAEHVNGDFEKFKDEYSIWDAGQNHFAVRNNEQNTEKVSDMGATYEIPYDNFVTRNMDAGGFQRMVAALRAYLEERGEE